MKKLFINIFRGLMGISLVFVAAGIAQYAYAAGMVVVTPSTPDWWFFEETPTGSGTFVYGPSTPPLGGGSAQLTVNGTGGVIFGTFAFAGTRLDAITSLAYSTYRASGGSALAASLQLDIDTNVTDANTAWQGRLVYEPYYTHAVQTGVWQTWNPLDNAGTGNWWFTGAPGNAVCTINNPCTWSELRAAFPNAGIRSAGVNTGALQFKAGGGWSGGFVGSVDAFSIGINNVATTYDFELPFTVPTTTSVSPSSKGTGDSAFTITVNGTNFFPSSVVQWNGSNRVTTFISSTQLTASILSSDLSAAGTFSITVVNPTPGGGTSNTQTVAVTTPATTPNPESSEGGSKVAPTSVIISGRAYPGSTIELLRKSIQDETYRNTPEAISTVSADGIFRIQLTALLQGQYLFALRAVDKDGRKTGVIAFNTDLSSTDNLEARDIFVPPTVDFEKAVVALGKDIKIQGYAFAGDKIDIDIDGIMKGAATADKNGFWSYATSTRPFRIGDHYARARQTDASGKGSEFSISRTFRVSLLTFPKADFSGDDKVDITDWSIFLFRWNSTDKDLRSKIDINDDGKIDISDFSIFLQAINNNNE